MNKKTLIIIIASVIAVALIATAAIVILSKSFSKKDNDTSSGIIASDAVIIVGSVKGEVGKKVSVPVSIKNNPGIMAMLLEFKYDNAVLKYKGYTQGDFLTEYQFNDDNGTLRFLNLEDGDVKKDGVLVNLEFEILTKTDKTDITINVADDAIANYNQDLIAVKGVNGEVKIK